MGAGTRVLLRFLDQRQLLQASVSGARCSVCEVVAKEKVKRSGEFSIS